MKKLIYLLALILVLSGCSNASAEKVDKDEVRKEFTLSVFKNAEEIARQSGSTMAIDLISVLKNSILLCRTDGTNLNMVLDDDFYDELYDENIAQNRNFTFYFVPLIKENGDMTLDVGGQKVDMSNQAGFCNTSPLSLYVTDNFSKIFQTALIIHEGMHVYQTINAVYEEIEDEEIRRVMNEYDAYSIESELIRGLGGEKYLTLLDKVADNIEEANNINKCLNPSEMKKYASEIEKVFGRSKNDVEVNMRLSFLWIDSYFYYIENRTNIPVEELEDAKKNFLLEIYMQDVAY